MGAWGAPLGYRGLKSKSVDGQATGKIDVTKDSQYDNLYTDFVEADARMATLLKSVKKYNDAQMQLAEAAAQLADDLHILYALPPAAQLLTPPSPLPTPLTPQEHSTAPGLAPRAGSEGPGRALAPPAAQISVFRICKLCIP